MTWINPKTDWQPSSVPTAEDFNRIEGDLSDLKSTKMSISDVISLNNGGTGATSVAGARKNLGLGNTIGALPIANGGTGATSVASARSALGLGNTAGALPIECGGTGAANTADARTKLGVTSCSKWVTYYVSKGSDRTSNYNTTGSSIELKGIKVGDYIMYFGVIKIETNSDRWIKFDIGKTVRSVTATAYKETVADYTPGCLVAFGGNTVYLGNDENKSYGYSFTVTTNA